MAGKRSPRWSVAEAQAAVADQERSGLSIRAFCEERGWQSERLYRWKRRLGGRTDVRGDDAAIAALSFVRAEVSMPSRAASAAAESPTVMFELVLRSGQRLCFPADVDPIALARTVQTLEAQLC
jgi:transposase-like protein